MKLTESRIKQIILEELEQAQQDQEKIPPDVEMLLKNLPKIDRPEEYSSLVQSLMKYTPKGMSNSDKISVLKNLKILIDKLLSGKED